ncbi:MAG: hypothetical protein LUF87_03495 [Alistipes sp.]|nr:hypothetical protein [Alistipes sp.]
MDEIGKIVFNSLASKSPVWLPCVGTFGTEYIPAKDNGDGTITPPHNQVRFCEGRQEGAASVIDLMPGVMDGESAQARYDVWLVKAAERGPVVIDGIGVVNNGYFTPYESLVKALNPAPAPSKRIRAKKKSLTPAEKGWLVFIAVCVLVLAGGWTWWHYYKAGPTGHNRWNTKNAAVTDDMDRVPEYTGAVDDPDDMPAIEVTEEDIVVAEEASPAPVNTAVSNSPGSKPGFYVVGNVFSVPGNADEYIEKMKKKYPDLDYQKHAYKGGRTMVSLFGSTDWNEANRQRRRIEDLIYQYDLWVYEVK